MPSSPSTTILTGDAAAATTSWQPRRLDEIRPVPTGFTLPAFEASATAKSPSTRSFAISRTVGIPDDLLAAHSAAARAAGFAAGYASGIDEARAATRDRLAAREAAAQAAADEERETHRRAFDALFEAADELERLAAPSAADIEEQILEAAWSIASGILGTALADVRTRTDAALARALALAPSDEDVTVAVCPDDFAVLSGGENADGATGMTRLRRTRGLRTLTIVPDPSLAPGDAVATCGATTIDARLSAAIDRARQVLQP